MRITISKEGEELLLYLKYVEMFLILADILTESEQNCVIFDNSDNFLFENLSVSANI